MKKLNSLILTTILIAIVLITGCQNDLVTKNTSVNQPEANPKSSAEEPKEKEVGNKTDKSEGKESDSDKTSDGSLATPTEAYKTAFAARKNKDVKALKRVLSKDILEFFTEIGKEEQKTLDESLETLANKKQAATVEVRNEKINGDQATLEYKDENGNWRTMDFIKESDGWKLTLPDMQPPPDEKTR